MSDGLNLTNNANQNTGSTGSTSSTDGLSSAPAKSPLEEATKDIPDATPDSPSGPASEPLASDLSTPGMPVPAPSASPEVSMPEPTPESPKSDPLSGLGTMPGDTSNPESSSAESSPPPTIEPEPAPEPMSEPTPEPVLAPASPTEPEPAPAPEMPTPEEPVAPVIDTSPSSPTDKPAGSTEFEEPAPAPDTDEFLKNILANSDEQKPGENKPGEPVPLPSSSNEALPPTQGFGVPAETSSPVPEPPVSPEPPSPGGFNPQSLDSAAIGPSSAQSLDAVGAPMSKLDDSGNPVSGDVVGAMQKPASQGNPKTKLIILIIVALIIVIGGYLAYSKLLNPSNPATAPSTVSPLAIESSVSVSNDQVRKQDLKTIQQALLNLYAAENKYPVSAETIFLTGTTNVVAKALVNLPTLPVDPDPQKNYAYKSEDGKTFSLTAVLDDTADPAGVLENGLYLLKVTPTTVITVGITSINGPADPTNGTSDLTNTLPSL